MSAEKKLTTKIFRVLAAWFINVITALFGEERTKYLTALGQSAWAAGNSVDVGMNETFAIVCPELAQPGNEQIYTTQPKWDFREGQTLTLGGTASISDVDYPIPSLVYDSGYVAGAADAEQHIHVVFPRYMWLEDGHYVYADNSAVAAADEASVTSSNGFYWLGSTQVFPTGKFRFVQRDITYRHNCNFLAGGLDGFEWQEVSLISESSVTVNGSTASVPTTATVAVGTWVRLTYTESDASKTAYGYVSAVGEDEVTVTVVGACGTTISKVELYKPVGQ